MNDNSKYYKIYDNSELVIRMMIAIVTVIIAIILRVHTLNRVIDAVKIFTRIPVFARIHYHAMIMNTGSGSLIKFNGF